jgi:hypothetical protein
MREGSARRKKLSEDAPMVGSGLVYYTVQTTSEAACAHQNPRVPASDDSNQVPVCDDHQLTAG